MLEHTLDTANSILYLRPRSQLEENDFVQLAGTVDPYIQQTGGLTGLIVEAPQFPGWESFGALAAHIRFVRDHHRKVKRIALVTDSAIGKVAEHLAAHFVSSEIKRFGASELDAATQWVMNRS